MASVSHRSPAVTCSRGRCVISSAKNTWRSSLIFISTNISEIEKIEAKEILLWVKERIFQKNALPFKGKARNYR
ncbi:hypothetical protein FEK95_05730 [Escherichia coli]|nr:hypothetical protein [Escherichia coli]